MPPLDELATTTYHMQSRWFEKPEVAFEAFEKENKIEAPPKKAAYLVTAADGAKRARVEAEGAASAARWVIALTSMEIEAVILRFIEREPSKLCSPRASATNSDGV